ncbi:hypothetical protein KUV65_16830 [Maritalea mobilis]|uniref:hypothetical protein n=1 Tax=Maritalea mobilis TaxID=483324 RepID=UPI001C9492FD|nr:hypothetical protein [Maritalea mobilis]MBY6203040.1 hypothetical protein [Maritalea mobilis]
MALDDLQQPNIGEPDFAKGASSPGLKMCAILTTIGFAIFWVSALFTVAGVVGGSGMHWSMPVLCVIGLAVGIFGRRRVECR